jgi:hypothetical protein
VRGVSVPAWPSREEPCAGVTDGRWTSWRLLGGNNHELGRGALLHPDDEACVAALRRLRTLDVAAAATVAIRRDAWWWQVDVDGERLAVSSRGYQRQRECRYNLDHFLAELPTAAVPEPGAVPPGRRPRREASPAPRRAAATVTTGRLIASAPVTTRTAAAAEGGA